ncbi:MAG: hydrogenase/urease maturation nickel metallochaperone HypA [Pseudomonadota bacterium]
MHEAKVAQYAFDIIKEATPKHVTKITFGVGKPNTVMRDSFEMYFLGLIKGSALEKAELIYEDSNEEGFFVFSIEVDDGN